MIIKGLTDEDFINYKNPSMFIVFPRCTFKCDKENGRQACQNSALAAAPDIDIPAETIVERYIKNPITSAIVCGGLEPFDTFDDLEILISKLREKTSDPVVIYTGYKEAELAAFGRIKEMARFKNVIIKFGRFIPDNPGRYDEVLGIRLASDNQYARKIS